MRHMTKGQRGCCQGRAELCKQSDTGLAVRTGDPAHLKRAARPSVPPTSESLRRRLAEPLRPVESVTAVISR